MKVTRTSMTALFLTASATAGLAAGAGAAGGASGGTTAGSRAGRTSGTSKSTTSTQPSTVGRAAVERPGVARLALAAALLQARAAVRRFPAAV